MFAITSPTGFVDEETVKIDLPLVTIEFEEGAGLGVFARASKVLLRRDSAFSTADIEVVDARIDFFNQLGFATGPKVGMGVKISVSGSLIFQGYVVTESMNASGGSDRTKNEDVIFKCVDYKYDLYREVMIGQIGRQADKDTGEEAPAGGLYGKGIGWFSGLDCVFNDRTFEKLAESSWSRTEASATIGQLGNMRADSSFGDDPGVKVFDGNYQIHNKSESDKPVLDTSRNRAWSGYDMINYILAFCFAPPWTKTIETDDVLPPICSSTRIKLGSANGMDFEFPSHVDVQGLRGTDAISKVCEATGYSWSLDMTTSPCTLKLFRNGSPGLPSLDFYMTFAGSGLPSGLYSTLSGPLSYDLVTTSLWNIDDIDITIDYTPVIGTVIGTTQNIRVQNCFPLRAGWSNKKSEEMFDAVLDTKDIAGAIDRESHVSTIKASADGQSKQFQVKSRTGDVVQLEIFGPSDDEEVTAKEQDSFRSIFRRWVTDETGVLNDPKGKPRKPYNFVVLGLKEENSSTYMVKPRPFLSNNISASKSGDRTPPKTFFFKVEPGQQERERKATLTPGEVQNARLAIALTAKLEAFGGKSFTPFGSKKGSVKILKDVSGIYIDGGGLDMQCYTVNPKSKTIYALAPVVVGAVEHDQAVVKIKTYFAGVGKFPAGRRWVDGRKFRVDRVFLASTKGFADPEAIDKGGSVFDSTPDKILKTFSVDESVKLEEALSAPLAYYKSSSHSIRVKIPTITFAYNLGDKIKGILGRIDLSAEELPLNSIVGIEFDLLAMNTIISVDAEENNPNLQISNEGF